jgi:4-hydroxybenzoyl-CoA thioesterase
MSGDREFGDAQHMLKNNRRVVVEFGHCDPSGIVYNPNYFIWFDFSVHALLARGGLSLKAMIDDFGIDGIPVAEYRTKFLAPSRWGDELIIESSIVSLQRCAFDIEHRVINAGVLAVECAETRVCTALDAHQRRVRARELPEKLVAAFQAESGRMT